MEFTVHLPIFTSHLATTSISTHYRDTKGDTKYRNGVVCGS